MIGLPRQLGCEHPEHSMCAPPVAGTDKQPKLNHLQLCTTSATHGCVADTSWLMVPAPSTRKLGCRQMSNNNDNNNWVCVGRGTTRNHSYKQQSQKHTYARILHAAHPRRRMTKTQRRKKAQQHNSTAPSIHIHKPTTNGSTWSLTSDAAPCVQASMHPRGQGVPTSTPVIDAKPVRTCWQPGPQACNQASTQTEHESVSLTLQHASLRTLHRSPSPESD